MKEQENGWGKKEKKLFIVAFNRQFLRGDATCRLLFSLRSVAGRGHGCRKSSSKTAVVRNIGNGEGNNKNKLTIAATFKDSQGGDGTSRLSLFPLWRPLMSPIGSWGGNGNLGFSFPLGCEKGRAAPWMGLNFDWKIWGEKMRECMVKIKTKNKLAFAASYRQFLIG